MLWSPGHEAFFITEWQAELIVEKLKLAGYRGVVDLFSVNPG
jgi:hypothetical protein